MAGLEPSWNGDVALATLQPAPVFPELYEPLWLYSGGSAANGSNNSTGYLSKGYTGILTASASTQIHLFALGANWFPTQKFSFEVALWVTSGGTAWCAIYDCTSSTTVSGSQVSTTSTTATVLRSGQFTLTPGHVYAVNLYPNTTSYTASATDASLIIFPSAPLTSPSVSAISLAGGNVLKEAYYGLWIYSSGTVNTSSAPWVYVQKGSTSTSSSVTSATKLYNLSSNWSSTQKFAFAASFYSGSSSNTAGIELWDMTSNAGVSASQVDTTSTTSTLIRSGSFTLTPGHSYGVAMSSSGGSTIYLTKCHLVAIAN